MSSEMEQTLDEILSGVESLLAHAPVGASAVQPSLPHSPEKFSRGQGVTLNGADTSSLLATLALMESDSRSPIAAQASRWIQKILSMRAVPLEISAATAGRFDPPPQVSPILQTRLCALAAQGALLAECDASTMLWDISSLDPIGAIKMMGRLYAAVCPEQNNEKKYWRISRMPERLPLKRIQRSEFAQQALYTSAEYFTVIDQDKANSKLATVLWIGDMDFVPDWWVAMAAQDGRWVPVVMMH